MDRPEESAASPPAKLPGNVCPAKLPIAETPYEDLLKVPFLLVVMTRAPGLLCLPLAIATIAEMRGLPLPELDGHVRIDDAGQVHP